MLTACNLALAVASPLIKMLSSLRTTRLLAMSLRSASGNAHLLANRNLGENILNPLDDSSQFSKARLVNHGELEDGEIPEALRFSRNCETGVLKNGMRVATESFASPLSNLTIAVKSGVRNENIKTNGVGYFIEKLL
jgi:hypothetical protein